MLHFLKHTKCLNKLRLFGISHNHLILRIQFGFYFCLPRAQKAQIKESYQLSHTEVMNP